MAIQTTYNKARDNFDSLLDQVTADREIVIINRRGSEGVAMVAASELSSLLETAHLLRSPKNAQRLLKALHRAQARTLNPQPLDEFRREIGLDEEKGK